MPDSKITLNDLPLRPKKLSESELEGVFGGCKKKGETGCKKNKDCCEGQCAGVVSTMKWTNMALGIQAPFSADDFGTTKCIS